MSEVLLAPTIRILYWCHLPPITVRVEPTPVDSKLFPNAKEGFENFSMVKDVSEFGQKYALADISGLTHEEVRQAIKAHSGHFITEPLRLLQTLEYLEGESGFRRYPEVLSFTQLVAYHGQGMVTVVSRLPGGGFKRVEPKNVRHWEPCTVGLFWFDSL